MPEPFEHEGNNPVYERSAPEPKYKTISFIGELEDDRENWYYYSFSGDYFEFDGTIQFVKASLDCSHFNNEWGETPIIPQDELQNILRIDIREELNTDYSIIFETKIELK